jgi:hypothetical protein
MRQIFHDETLQQQFVRSGYNRVPMLSAAEVSHMLSQLATLRPGDGFAPAGGRYHCSFLDTNIDYKRETHRLIKSLFATRAAHYLNGYEILNCNFYVKPPGTGEFVVHQNWPAIADLNDTTVTIWCPLVDVVESNGTLQFVEGSHKLFQHVEGPNVAGYFRDFRQALIKKYLKPIPMSAGEALIFDDGLIHWSANNDSDKARIAIQILCVPADAQPVYFFYDPKTPDRFELIAVDSEFFINTPATALTTRQPQWKGLGFVENRNQYPTEEEFLALLARGNEIRREIYR